MTKAEQFIIDCTRTCSNELTDGSYAEWLTPSQALRAVEIALEEARCTVSIAQPLEDAEAEEYIEPEAENLNLNDLSRFMLEKALERNHGNRKKAAQELGISDRTFYRRLKQYGL